MRHSWIYLIFVLALNGCSSSLIHPTAEDQVVSEGVLKFWVSWVKDKKDKFDMELNFNNENPEKGIIILLSDIQCGRGKMSGMMKHTFFNTGERTIDFKPHQTKSFNTVCKLSGQTTGDFSVTISRVYENPNMDGKTIGKVLAKDILWVLPEPKEEGTYERK